MTDEQTTNDDPQVEAVDNAWAIFTEMEDGTLNLCRCPSTWEQEGDGYRRAAFYANAGAALLALKSYSEKHPESYYAVVNVTLALDTDMLAEDKHLQHVADLSLAAALGDDEARDEAMEIMAGTS